MKDWNVIVSVYQDGFTPALHALEKLGPVDRTPYYNILVMKVDDPMSVLDAVEQQSEEIPALYDAISRVAPAMQRFGFQSGEEFKAKAKPVLQAWSARLAGRSFHARLRRRGERHELPSPDIEKFLDEEVLVATKARGAEATVLFEEPEAVIAVDTIDDQAAMSLWTREDLARHRLLRPD